MMRKTAAILAVLVCILAGIASGITGCSEQCENEIHLTEETLEAIESLAPLETEEPDETETGVFPPVPEPYSADAEIAPTISLTRELSAEAVTPADITAESAIALTEFALDLAMQQDGQFLLSPVSLASALAMTANGANGDTLSQTEAVLGIDRDSLNSILHAYTAKNGEKISLANSIWFRCFGFTPNEEFLRTAVKYYNADLFTAPFTAQTVSDVNSWISEKTRGMIPRMLNEMDRDTVMYLINAVYFEKQWDEIYATVTDGEFTSLSGETQCVHMLESVETSYFEDEHAVGFAKPYMWCDYRFVALLPKEGMTPAEYLAALTGEKLNELLTRPQEIPVRAVIPKFKTEYEAHPVKDLTSLGMTDIFDSIRADLTGLGSASGNLYVGDIVHKAVMELDETGTKAAAATVVAVVEECEIIPPEPEKTVILDRPFVYMITDSTGIPLFIGTLESVLQ